MTQADGFYAYMRGWVAGAACKVIDKNFENHKELAPIYKDGWAAGRVARQAASERATEISGYRPSVLRLAIDEDCDEIRGG